MKKLTKLERAEREYLKALRSKDTPAWKRADSLKRAIAEHQVLRFFAGIDLATIQANTEELLPKAEQSVRSYAQARRLR